MLNPHELTWNRWEARQDRRLRARLLAARALLIAFTACAGVVLVLAWSG